MNKKAINMNGISDQDMLRGINQKHYGMFRYFYINYYPGSVRQAYASIKNMEVAEEIADDVFIRLWKLNNRFATMEEVKSYLYVSVKNRCLNYLGRKEPSVNIDISSLPEQIQPESDEAVRDHDLLQFIYEELSKLPPAQQSTMWKFLEGYSDHEVAEMLGISPLTVRNTRQIVYNKLRKRIADTKTAVIFCWFLINYDLY